MNEGLEQCDASPKDAKAWLIDLWKNHSKNSLKEIEDCFKHIILQDKQDDPDIQNILRGFYWTLFSVEDQMELPVPNNDTLQNKFPFKREEVDRFLDLSEILSKKNIMHLKKIVTEYVEDILIATKLFSFCHDIEEFKEYLEFCLNLCEKFKCSTTAILRDKEVKHQIVDVLKGRYEVEELKECAESMKNFGLTLNYQKNRGKNQSKKMKADEKAEEHRYRIMVRDLGSISSGGGRWVSAG